MLMTIVGVLVGLFILGVIIVGVYISMHTQSKSDQAEVSF